jgi:DNA-binding transcriptional regulator GbsR (MarR family)
VRIYRKKQDKEIRDKVKKIWKGIYEAYKSSEDVDEIFAELTEFFAKHYLSCWS